MRTLILRTLAVFFATFLLTAMSTESAYQHKVEVSDMTFEWKIDGENIDIRMSAPTTGWVGIGFNPSKKMMDANFIIGYVKKGELRIADEYGTSARAHAKDTKADGQMNIMSATGVEENDITTISFAIPLDSGDKLDQALDPNGETTVLLAYGSGRDSFRTKHKDHAVLKVNLSTGEYTDAAAK